MEKHHQTIRRIHWYLLGVVAIVFILVVLLIQTSQTPSVDQSQTSPTQEGVQKGTVTLAVSGNQRKYQVNVPLTLSVLADSQGEDIVGFDMIVQYDPEAFTAGNVSTQLTSFQTVLVEPEAGTLIVRGIQGLNDESKFIFKDTSIAQITFTPTRAGIYTFSLVPQVGKETTKFVNTQTEKIFPTTANTEVEVF